jgi:hypothetical protein
VVSTATRAEKSNSHALIWGPSRLVEKQINELE